MKEEIEKAPLRFTPYLKSVVWGGDGINRYKGLPPADRNIGESWEISVVPGCESLVAGGLYDGMSLAELVNRFGAELVGENCIGKYGNKFPLLIKILDAHDNLSMQVHPDDDLAMKRHGISGKDEMWYVVAAEKEARIYCGLNRRITPEEYDELVARDEFYTVVQSYESHPGDIFYIPSGRVHAAGKGNLLIEIQESSDITYRIYDYNRMDADGNKRQLHTELAKDAIDYEYLEDYRSPVPSPEQKDMSIVKSRHFHTRRLIVDSNDSEPLTPMLDPDSFAVLICVDGDARIKFGASEWAVSRGETLLVPAVMHGFSVKGDAVLLSVQV